MPNKKQAGTRARQKRGSSDRLVRYKQVARGAWKQMPGHAHRGAIAALEQIASRIAGARELAEVHDIVRSLAEIKNLDQITDASLRDGLVNRSGGVRVGPPADTGQTAGAHDLLGLGRIPTHTGTGGGSRGPSYRPGTSLGFGGIAGQDSGGVSMGVSMGAHGRIVRGSDGSTVVMRTEKFSSGTTLSTTVTYEGGSVTRTDFRVTNPDGSATSGGVVHQEDGGRVDYTIETDKEGNITSTSERRSDAEGNPIKDPDIAGQPGVDGEGSDGDLARHFRAWHKALYGPAVLEFSVPAFVNPGTPETADAVRTPAGGINIRDSLVVNPDPNSATGPGRAISEDAARRMKDQIKGGGSPGPNPGPRPGR